MGTVSPGATAVGVVVVLALVFDRTACAESRELPVTVAFNAVRETCAISADSEALLDGHVCFLGEHGV